MSEDPKETIKFPAVPPPPPSEKEFPSSHPSQQPSRPSMRSQLPSITPREWLTEQDTARTTDAALSVEPVVREKNRASLTVINGFNAGQIFTLEHRESVIGRGREAHVRIEDAGVSRMHARVMRTMEGRYMVEDLKSTNGTFVGSRRVEIVELGSGDHIQIGPNVVLSFALVDEQEEKLAKQLYESSTRDALTQAFNRKYLAERLVSEVAYATRHKTKLALVLFDLDHFKKTNDAHGHLAGDEVLRCVSACVARMIRAEDVFARYGGEEFVVLVRGIEHPNVVRFAERLRHAIAKLSIPFENMMLRATVSIGLASFDECGDTNATGDDLFLLADDRLYRAKAEGRNRVCSA